MVNEQLLIPSLLFVGIIVVAVSIVFAGRRRKTTSTASTAPAISANQPPPENNKWSWAKHPAALIGYGLIVFNFISWAMIPWWWKILTYTWYTWLFFNLGFWTVLYLRTIKVKDAAGKDTKEDNPIASKLASILALILVAGLITTSWLYFKTGDLTQKEYVKKQEDEKTIRRLLIKEPVLAGVAKCQPKEFDTPKKLEDAIKLYADKGLLPWHGSMTCWEGSITKDMLPVRLAIVKAPTKGWSIEVKSPRIKNGAIVDWPSVPRGKVLMAPNGDESKKAPCENKSDFDFVVYYTQFQSLDTKPINVEIVVKGS